MRLLTFACALLAAASLAAAAPCPDCTPGTPLAERDRHSLVFEGIVFAVRDSTLPRVRPDGPPPFIRLVGLHVRATWKGLPSRSLVVQLDPCARISPQPGEFWALYADSVDGQVVVPRCTRSTLHTKATAELDAFGAPASLVLPRSKRTRP